MIAGITSLSRFNPLAGEKRRHEAIPRKTPGRRLQTGWRRGSQGLKYLIFDPLDKSRAETILDMFEDCNTKNIKWAFLFFVILHVVGSHFRCTRRIDYLVCSTRFRRVGTNLAETGCDIFVFAPFRALFVPPFNIFSTGTIHKFMQYAIGKSDLQFVMHRNMLTVCKRSRYYRYKNISSGYSTERNASEWYYPECRKDWTFYRGGSSAMRLSVVGTGILETNRYHFASGGYDFSTIPTGRHQRNGDT